ncbi:MAG TPA: hypothetical protein VFW96_10670 [Thermomicrobiales bacterium]|nr:hypothetical protein [Thermomicrobiales bacterium]
MESLTTRLPDYPTIRLVAFALALVAVAAIAAHRLPSILAFQAAMLRYPYPTQGSEGLIVYEASRLAHGQGIYVANTPGAHAFVSGPYTPLYFLAVALTLKLTPTVFAGGRAITFCAWLALLALLGALVYQTAERSRAVGQSGSRAAEVRRQAADGGRQKDAGESATADSPIVYRLSSIVSVAAAVLLLAVFSPGVIWAVRVKPTIPALALAAAGLLLVQRWRDSPRREWALVFFVAAYFTKQTELAAPLAATLFLLVNAGWRQAARFVGLGLLGGGAIFAALDLATQNEFFRHTVGDRRLPWEPQLLWNFGTLFLRDYWPLLAAALCAAVALALARAATVAPYYLATALIFLPMIGVVGADHDHLIELATACALAVGTALAVLAGRRDALAWTLVPVAALLVALVATAWTPDRWYAGELNLPSPAEQDQLAKIVHNLRYTPGDALAEDVGLLVLAGKPVPYDDPQAMAALSRAGRWDQAQLLDDLAQQRFSLVLLPPNTRPELWTDQTLAAIHANYYLKFRDVWFTYEANRLR